jgi:hypothetical protein
VQSGRHATIAQSRKSTKPSRKSERPRRSHRAGTTSDDLSIIAGVRISHPDRLAFPDLGLTKLDVIRYYDSVADWMLPHLRARPLTLVQCAPDADHCRYLRHSGERAPEQVRVVNIQEQTKVGALNTRIASCSIWIPDRKCSGGTWCMRRC